MPYFAKRVTLSRWTDQVSIKETGIGHLGGFTRAHGEKCCRIITGQQSLDIPGASEKLRARCSDYHCERMQ